MESFTTELEILVRDARGSYALGEERYTTLLREKELLGYGAARAARAGRGGMGRDRRADAGPCPTGRSVGGRLAPGNRVAQRRPSVEPRGDARVPTRTGPRELAGSCADNDLVTLPDGEKCLVEPSPPFQRPVLAVASYSQPPAFRPGLTGHFFVPFPPDGTSPEEIQKTARFEQLPQHPDDLGARGVPGPPLAPHVDEGEPAPGQATGVVVVLRGGLGSLRREDDARAGFLRRSPGGALPPRREDLPCGADHRGHGPAHRRPRLRRRRRDHADPGEPSRAGRACRGRPVLRVADPGAFLPDRLSRDRAHPRASTWPRSAATFSEFHDSICAHGVHAARAGRAGPVRRPENGLSCAQTFARSVSRSTASTYSSTSSSTTSRALRTWVARPMI